MTSRSAHNWKSSRQAAVWGADAESSSYDDGNAIAGPDGEWIVEPVRREETLMLADLGPALIRAQRQNSIRRATKSDPTC